MDFPKLFMLNLKTVDGDMSIDHRDVVIDQDEGIAWMFYKNRRLTIM